MMGLTQRQADCLAAIKAHIAECGNSPSYGDIARRLGLRSKSGISRLVQGLRQRGHIDFLGGASRSIVLREAVEVVLPPDLAARLRTFCAARGEQHDEVICDAVTLHLDSFSAIAEREAIAVFAAAFDPPPLPRLRCSECNNGVDPEWTYCPFCGAQGRAESVKLDGRQASLRGLPAVGREPGHDEGTARSDDAGAP